MSRDEESILDGQFDLIVSSARTELDACGLEHIRDLVQRDVHWPSLIQLARLHGVHLLLYRSLAQACAGDVPEEVGAVLRRVFHGTAGINLSMLRELREVLDLLSGHGIAAIPFKGPVLAAASYRNLGLRPCTDLDLLIPEKSFGAAEAVLAQSGYSVAGNMTRLRGLGRTTYLYITKQSPFVKRGGTALDVHVGIMPPRYSYAPQFEALFARCMQLQAGGVTVPTFAPEDLLLILCFQGVNNRWEKLKHYCDVAETLRAYPELDWDALLQRAQSEGAQRVLYLGLHLAHSVLDAPVPDELLARIREDRHVPALAGQVVSGMRRIHKDRLERPDRFRFHLGVQDGVAGKFRYLVFALGRQANEKIFRTSPE